MKRIADEKNLHLWGPPLKNGLAHNMRAVRSDFSHSPDVKSIAFIPSFQQRLRRVLTTGKGLILGLHAVQGKVLNAAIRQAIALPVLEPKTIPPHRRFEGIGILAGDPLQ